jgi:hypothetical protein
VVRARQCVCSSCATKTEHIASSERSRLRRGCPYNEAARSPRALANNRITPRARGPLIQARQAPIDSLGNDACCTKLASVRKDGRAVFGEVFVNQDASINIAREPCQRCLAVEERALRISSPSCSMRSKAWRIAASATSLQRSFSKRDKTSGPSTTASPSIVKLLALIRAARSAIARSRLVQSFALRL